MCVPVSICNLYLCICMCVYVYVYVYMYMYICKCICLCLCALPPCGCGEGVWGWGVSSKVWLGGSRSRDGVVITRHGIIYTGHVCNPILLFVPPTCCCWCWWWWWCYRFPDDVHDVVVVVCGGVWWCVRGAGLWLWDTGLLLSAFHLLVIKTTAKRGASSTKVHVTGLDKHGRLMIRSGAIDVPLY